MASPGRAAAAATARMTAAAYSAKRPAKKATASSSQPVKPKPRTVKPTR